VLLLLLLLLLLLQYLLQRASYLPPCPLCWLLIDAPVRPSPLHTPPSTLYLISLASACIFIADC
jgi:hypothetical protein